MRMLLPSVFLLFLLPNCAQSLLHAQSPGDELRWPFSHAQNEIAVDTVHGVKANIKGQYTYVPGVGGDALRLDGYSTSITVPAADLPSTAQGFSVEAWVAVNTYPWNWVPIFDQQSQHQAGFYFGLDAFGHVGLQASINGQWRSAISATTIPLKQWTHLAGTYQTAGGHGVLTVYMNGSKVAELAVEGELSPSKSDLLIGRVREAMLPFPEAEVKPPQAVWYSLDGILDELAILAHSRSADEVARDVRPPCIRLGERFFHGRPCRQVPLVPAGSARTTPA